MNLSKLSVIGFTAAVLGMMAMSPAVRAEDAHPRTGANGAADGSNAGRNAAIADQPADEKTSKSSGGCCG